jgi:hypothetical protein
MNSGVMKRLAHGSRVHVFTCQNRMFKIFKLKEVKHTGALAVELRITKTEINLAQDRDKFWTAVNSGNARIFSTT